MPRQIVLVSCVSEKRSIPSPARSLYTSAWFKKATAYAEKIADEWYILSAKYELVNPDQMLEPYNMTLKTMPKPVRKNWAERVFVTLQPHLKSSDTVIFLAGQVYREFLPALISQIDIKTEIPMEGLRIGEQMHWLDQQMQGH